MPFEVGLVFDTDGKTLYWHLPQDRQEGFLPDSNALWEILKNHSYKGKLGGMAHVHPWDGAASPSHTDITTWRAIELGLGKCFTWIVASFNDIGFYGWDGNKYEPFKFEESSTMLNNLEIEELRRMSKYPLEEIVLWTCDDCAETLTSEDKDEAIEYHLDDLDLPLPDTVTVYGYARMEIDREAWHKVFKGSILEQVIERLDEEFNASDDPTNITVKMQEAEKKFIDAILDEYIPWSCEQVYEEEVDVAEWVKKNAPHWFENETFTIEGKEKENDNG